MRNKRRTIYLTLILLAIITAGALLLVTLKDQDKPDAGENIAQDTSEVKTIILEPEDINSDNDSASDIKISISNESDKTTDNNDTKKQDQSIDTPKNDNHSDITSKTDGSNKPDSETTKETQVRSENEPSKTDDKMNKESITEKTATDDSETKNPETTDETQSEENDSNKHHDWVETLPAARTEKQIMVVAATGSSATLSLHNRQADGNWSEIFTTKASIGKNGIGKSKEGDHKTPRGSYRFTMGFGLKQPGNVNLPYTQVDENCFWVDDPSSKYYNQFVSLRNVEKDWNSAESLSGSGKSYNYALAINYNEACVPGKGSAIFLHCLPTGGAGCIAVSEEAMVRLLKETSPGCLLLIDYASELGVK